MSLQGAELAIGRLHDGCVMLGPVGELYADGTSLADDVEVGRNQAVLGDDEAGAQALLDEMG